MLESSQSDRSALPPVPVFRGSQAECAEFGLVLDAKGIFYERVASDAAWLLVVAPDAVPVAHEELTRYAGERVVRREEPAAFVPFPGGGIGAGCYAALLILIAYCAGVQLFDRDWFAVGALAAQPGGAIQGWRAVTALTLHVDQEHLLGNLLFGIGIGTLAGRTFGPGLAWLAIVLAAAAANLLDLLVSPAGHRAVGASTAVFAALGLLCGFGWGQRLMVRARRLYRWAPLFAGVSLLALLGAGNEHVDVLGHLLGFLAGILAGWALARSGPPRRHGAAVQFTLGGGAVLLIALAWWLALAAGGGA